MNSIKNKFVALLYWSEKYTKTDMLYLARGGSWLGLGQIVAALSAFLSSIAFANLLPPEIYGFYKYVLSIANIILVTTLTGMDSAVIQAVATGFEGTIITGIKTKLKWGALSILVSLIIAFYYYTQGNLQLTLVFCLVAIFLPFGESFDLYNAFLVGKKLFSVQTKYNIIRKTLTLIILVGTLFITKNIYVILLVYFLTSILPAIFFFRQTIKKHLSNKDVDPGAITYGKHLSAVHIIGLVMGELDKILVFHYLGAINLAVYALAVSPTEHIKGLLKNVNALAMPQFSNRTPEDIKKMIWHKIGVLFLAISILILAYIILAPTFFGLFFPKYLASINYSRVLSISIIPAVLTAFIYTILESQKDKVGIYKYNIYFNIFSIIILIPFVYYYGLWGAVISRLITRIFTLSVAIRLIKKVKPS